MKQLMVPLLMLLLMLVAMAALTHGQLSAQLSGSEGLSLLKSIANVSSNLTEMNNSTINLSSIPTSIQVGGNDSAEQWQNLTYDELNSSAGNLSSWGSEPRTPPPPPSRADMDKARIAGILKINHGIV